MCARARGCMCSRECLPVSHTCSRTHVHAHMHQHTHVCQLPATCLGPDPQMQSRLCGAPAFASEALWQCVCVCVAGRLLIHTCAVSHTSPLHTVPSSSGELARLVWEAWTMTASAPLEEWAACRLGLEVGGRTLTLHRTLCLSLCCLYHVVLPQPALRSLTWSAPLSTVRCRLASCRDGWDARHGRQRAPWRGAAQGEGH